MKKVFLLLLFASIINAYAQKQLTNFQQIYDALTKGKNVKVVFHYAKCQLIADNEIKDKVPDAIGGMNIDNYEYFAVNSVRNKNAFIAFSKTLLIQDPLSDDGYVYNYVKVKVSDDNKVKITARYIDPLTYKNTMDENFFTTINNGKDEGAAYFYEY